MSASGDRDDAGVADHDVDPTPLGHLINMLGHLLVLAHVAANGHVPPDVPVSSANFS